MSTAKIYCAGADLDQDEAMSAFIDPIPNGDKLLEALMSGMTGRSHLYDQELRKAFFVVSDGKHVECYAIEGVTEEQAAQVSAACDSIATWDKHAFIAAAERALGDVRLVH